MRKLGLLFFLIVAGITVKATNLLTPSGYKDLTAMSIGDSVLAYDIRNGHIIYNILEEIEPITKDFFYPDTTQFTWYLINGTYKVFKYQSIWNHPTSCVHAFELTVGDTVYDEQNNNVIVNSVVETTGDTIWNRLVISGDHSFISEGLTFHNASRFWVGGNGTWDATAGSKWSSSADGSGGSSVPSPVDDVALDTATGHGNVTISVASCKAFDCSAYLDTLKGSGTISVYGNLTFSSGMTITATGALMQAIVTSTWTSAGKSWPGTISIAGNGSLTLGDNWTTVNITFARSAGGVGNTTVNGSKTIYVSGVYTLNNHNRGNLTIEMVGASCSVVTNGLLVGHTSLRLNSPGAIDLSTLAGLSSTNLVYVAGTVTMPTSLYITNNTTLTNCSSLPFVNISSTNGTHTISSNITLSGTYIANGQSPGSSPGNGISTVNGGYTITCNSLSCAGCTGYGGLAGNSLFKVVGSSGSIISGTGTGMFAANIEINSPGTITFVNPFRFGSGKTLTYTAGTLAGAVSATTLTTSATLTFNAAVGTLPFTSLTTTASTTFNGSNGFTVGTFTCATAAVTNTFQANNTYTITGALTLTGTAASRVSMVSSSGSASAILTLNQGATSDVGYVTATRIDSNAGRSIWAYSSTLTSAINWKSFPTQKTIGYVF